MALEETNSNAFVPLKLLLHGVPLRNTLGTLSNTPSSSRILDKTNFQWMMNNETACFKEQNTSKLMVILVHTARANFQERDSIRDTWGSLKLYRDWSLRVIFLLGEAENDELSARIFLEFREHGDMVMGNFKDTYRNLRYKHLMGYKWILDFCHEATYVWKVDDDVFIDPLTIVEWRNNEIADSIVKNGKSKLIDFYCPVTANAEPQRDPSLKWFVSQEIWPLREFPTYCSGWAYGISVPWIRNIFSVSESVNNALWIDDVFVTGVLVHLVNKLRGETPHVKNIWRYSTFNYDPKQVTFCLDKYLAINDLRKTKRKFGAFGRLLRGSTLMRENKCIWGNIISGKWDVVRE